MSCVGIRRQLRCSRRSTLPLHVHYSVSTTDWGYRSSQWATRSASDRGVETRDPESFLVSTQIKLHTQSRHQFRWPRPTICLIIVILLSRICEPCLTSIVKTAGGQLLKDSSS